MESNYWYQLGMATAEGRRKRHLKVPREPKADEETPQSFPSTTCDPPLEIDGSVMEGVRGRPWLSLYRGRCNNFGYLLAGRANYADYNCYQLHTWSTC